MDSHCHHLAAFFAHQLRSRRSDVNAAAAAGGVESTVYHAYHVVDE